MASSPMQFKLKDRVQYFSVNQREWYKATVEDFDATKHTYTVRLDGSNYIKKATTEKLRPLYEKGDAVEYYSASQLGWYPATVISSTYTKSGQLEVKVDGVVKKAKNDQLRKPQGPKTNDIGPYLSRANRRRQKYTRLTEEEMKEMRNKKGQGASVNGGEPASMYDNFDCDDVLASNDEPRKPTKQPQLTAVDSNQSSGGQSCISAGISAVGGGDDPASNYSSMPDDDAANNYNAMPTENMYSSMGASDVDPSSSSSKSAAKNLRKEAIMRSAAPSGGVRKDPYLKAKANAASGPRLETKFMHTAKVCCIRLKPGRDLLESLKEYVTRMDIRAGYIQACVGSTSTTVLRPAGVSKPKVFEGKFEIVSMSGTISKDSCHIHLSISDSECKTFGGHLMKGTIVRTCAEVVIGNVQGLWFARELDEDSGYDELVVIEH